MDHNKVVSEKSCRKGLKTGPIFIYTHTQFINTQDFRRTTSVKEDGLFPAVSKTVGPKWIHLC